MMLICCLGLSASSTIFAEVNAANVVSIEKIENCYAPKFNELSDFFETEDSYEVYLVGIDMTVNINTEHFYNGINYKLVVLVNNNGVWQVGGQSGAPIEVLLKSNGMFVDEAITSYSMRVFDDEAVTFGTGYGLLAPGSVPKTIKVANAAGTTVYKVNFADFIKNVTQNEIGNLGFNSNAIKAQTMAAKMCGWWAKVAQYRDSVGAEYLATNSSYKYGWEKFLHYYYNSSFNNPNVGIVKIGK